MSFSTSNSEHNQAARVFTFCAIALLLVLAGAYWLVRLYFTATGDLLPLSTVAKQLFTKGGEKLCTYMNAISSDTNQNLKFRLYENAPEPPGVVALGSSRVLALYQPMFHKPFLNLGRAYQFPVMGQDFLNLIDKTTRTPHLALIGIDFWWFNRRYMKIAGGTIKSGITNIDPNDLRQLHILVKGIWDEPARLRFLPELLTLPPCPIGVIARLKNVGFLSDGGMVYRQTRHAFRDFSFRDTLDRIRRKKGNFSHGKQPDMRQIQQVMWFATELKKRGVKVVAYFPPVAPTVFQVMRKSGKYAYIERAVQSLAKAGFVFYNYLDPTTLGLHDCEFLDGFHPGDVANALILLDLAQHEPELAQVLDLQFLRRLAANRGMAMMISNTLTNRKEEDFLGLGCKKKVAAPLPYDQVTTPYLNPRAHIK